MDIQKRIEMITTVSTFISSIMMLVNCIYEDHNIIFYISLICVLSACALSCYYWIKRYPIWKRYKFIRYLFFEIRENKFNIAPKVLLFLDLMNKRNNFVIKELSANYTLKENSGVIDSNVVWSLDEVSNVISNDFYFYTGIDLGRIQNQQFIITCNGLPATGDLLEDNKDDSENGIFLCHWNIPERTIKDGKKIDNIELTMEQKNSFDFNNKEVIYLFPWNFARKIGKIKFKITYPKPLGDISMQLFEVGDVKGHKFPYNHSLEGTTKENFFEDKDGNTSTYEFSLEEKNINVENLYYILLHKIQ